MSKLDKIKDKIKALRARAEDSASTESEAMAAITRADALMKENSLTVEDLEGATLEDGIQKGVWGKGTKKLHPVEFVANAVRLLTETRGWIEYPDRVAQLAFLGLDHDVEYALYLIDLVHNAMESEWSKFKETDEYANTPRNKRGRLRDDFMRGMASRIREKIMQMVSDRRTQMADNAAATGTSLVVAKRNMIADAMQQLDIAPRKRRKSTKKVGPTGYYAGRVAGERTQIARGITA